MLDWRELRCRAAVSLLKTRSKQQNFHPLVPPRLLRSFNNSNIWIARCSSRLGLFLGYEILPSTKMGIPGYVTLCRDRLTPIRANLPLNYSYSTDSVKQLETPTASRSPDSQSAISKLPGDLSESPSTFQSGCSSSKQDEAAKIQSYAPFFSD